MRAATEVDKFPGGIKRNHRLGGFFFHQFALENLIAFFVQVESFGLGNELPLVREVLRRQLMHLFFDLGEVFLGERLVAEEFVEKAGVNGRANAEFNVGKEFHHSGS